MDQHLLYILDAVAHDLDLSTLEARGFTPHQIFTLLQRALKLELLIVSHRTVQLTPKATDLLATGRSRRLVGGPANWIREEDSAKRVPISPLTVYLPSRRWKNR